MEAMRLCNYRKYDRSAVLGVPGRDADNVYFYSIIFLRSSVRKAHFSPKVSIRLEPGVDISHQYPQGLGRHGESSGRAVCAI